MFARRLFSFFVPSGILFLATALILHMEMRAPSLFAFLRVYPYMVFGAGFLLGWRFNRSRLVFALLVLALADRSLFYLGSANGVPAGVVQTVYNAAALLLPLNLTALCLVKERGIFTLRGLWRLSLLVLQALGVVLMCRYPELGIGAYLEYTFIDNPLLGRIPLAQPALAAFCAGFSILIVRCIQRQGAIESSFFWALVSVFFAFASGRIGGAASIYFATAGLILGVSIIETSYTMAYHDELTGLPARRALNEALLKTGSRYTVAMVDIDHFKKFNDRYGHDVGDQVLRLVASKVAKVTGGGRPFRYGGEEFTVVFPGKFMDETIPHLERLRKAIEETRFTVRGRDRRRITSENTHRAGSFRQKATITVSIGAAERNGRQGTPDEVVKAADKALYRAKKAGRNQIST
ncbi:MAG: diguanylate cyclase [Syntrophobacteria bacterium]